MAKFALVLNWPDPMLKMLLVSLLWCYLSSVYLSLRRSDKQRVCKLGFVALQHYSASLHQVLPSRQFCLTLLPQNPVMIPAARCPDIP